MGLLRGVAIGIGVIIVVLFAFGGPEGIVALVAKADFSDRQDGLIEEATAPAENPDPEAQEPDQEFGEDESSAPDDEWEAPTIE